MNSEPNQQPQKSSKKIFLIGGGVLVAIVLIWIMIPKGKSTPHRESSTITMVNLPPITLPPPPPPPTPEQKLEEKNSEAQPIEPTNAPVAPDDDSAKAESNSNDGFGIKGSKNGKGFGTGGTRWGFYSSQLRAAVQEALSRNPKTRHARLHIEVRVWPDADGVLTRVELRGSTGNSVLDELIKNQVLGGLRLSPPPEGMPTPVTLRIKGSAPL